MVKKALFFGIQLLTFHRRLWVNVDAKPLLAGKFENHINEFLWLANK